jgi:hypothetical protein
VILFNFVSQSTFLQLQKLSSMKISRTKFVILFLVSAFAFQFISNSLLGSEVRLFPVNGEWFPGTGSPITWKSTVSTILYPIKIVLIGPLSFLGKDPDPAPPILVFAFALYWTAIALVLHYILSKIRIRKKI